MLLILIGEHFRGRPRGTFNQHDSWLRVQSQDPVWRTRDDLWTDTVMRCIWADDVDKVGDHSFA